jgi:hypothetical protein
MASMNKAMQLEMSDEHPHVTTGFREDGFSSAT